MSGARLVVHDLPPRGAWLSLTVAIPPHEVSAVGRVAWVDATRDTIGIELDRTSARLRHDLGMAILALASEAETDRPVVAVLVDDARRAAQLCEQIRRRGCVPLVVRTPLDAICVLNRDRPRVRLAVIAPRALGMTGDSVATFLSHEFPDVARLPVSS